MTWEPGNTGKRNILTTWELGNSRKPTILMTWEPGNTGKPIILMTWEPGNIGTPAILMTWELVVWGHLRKHPFWEHIPGKMNMVSLEISSKQAIS